MASNVEGPIFRMTFNMQFVIPLMLERDQVPAGVAWLGAGEPPFVSSVCITAVCLKLSEAETLLLEMWRKKSYCEEKKRIPPLNLQMSQV